MQNIEQQEEEILVLQSIYEDTITAAETLSNTYTLFLNQEDNAKEPLKFTFTYPKDYPSTKPPVFQLEASWLTAEAAEILINEMLNLYKELPDLIIYKCIEYLNENTKNYYETVQEKIKPEILWKKEIFKGTPITDRKSKFQAFCGFVDTTEEVNQFLEALKSNKKIANATHNIYAYRLSSNLQAREDDGEKAAGDKLLYLLTTLEANNVIIVVTRWYGGIQLGPDRFKHISNVAKELLETTLPKNKSINIESTENSVLIQKNSEKEFNRIKWDPNFDTNFCKIEYQSKLTKEIATTNFQDFEKQKLDFNRIINIIYKEEKIWSKVI